MLKSQNKLRENLNKSYVLSSIFYSQNKSTNATESRFE